MTDRPSDWQQRITGEWYGTPSVFDADGNHRGFIKVNRSSVFEDGDTIYTMHTAFEGGEALRARLEFSDFAFGVLDGEKDRIYLGPDFIGAGHPYGALVDSNYYSPAWTADLRTVVHILPDEITQVYSSLLYDGPTVAAVFNGLYTMATDYDTNPETRARVDSFTSAERANGSRPHLLEAKARGRWTGQMEVWNAAQEHVGTNHVTITHTPVTLLRAEQTVEIDGVTPRKYTFTRYRNGTLHSYEGPDMVGNGKAYGRALYTTQHINGEAIKMRGREFLIDDRFTLSAVWELFRGDVREYMTFGVLEWEATS